MQNNRIQVLLTEVKLKEMALQKKELDLEVVKCRLEHERIALKEKELQRELVLRKIMGQERECECAFVLKKWSWIWQVGHLKVSSLFHFL